MDRQIDGSTDSEVDMWGADERTHPGQVEGTRRRPQGQAEMNRAWKCVIFLWEEGERNFATLPNLIKPDAPTVSSF